MKYVQKIVDELTKNHRENDKENCGDGFMPEMPGNPLCPVKSFESYLEKLNPSCDRLWQRPKISFLPEEECWYSNSPIGVKKLQKFMPELSEKCMLSKRYTNHSIRATGATILSHQNFNPAQIMSVSGHKSVSSLSVYQHVGGDEEIKMGKAIAHRLSGENTEFIDLTKKSITTTNKNNNLIPEEIVDLKDLELSEFSMDECQLPVVLNNCTINNLTINMIKK